MTVGLLVADDEALLLGDAVADADAVLESEGVALGDAVAVSDFVGVGFRVGSSAGSGMSYWGAGTGFLGDFFGLRDIPRKLSTSGSGSQSVVQLPTSPRT